MDENYSVGNNSYHMMHSTMHNRYGNNNYDMNKCITLANTCMIILILLISISTCAIVSVQYISMSGHIMTGNYTSC